MKAKYVAVAMVLAMLSAVPVQALDGDWAFVDMERLFDGYYRTEQADAKLQEQAEEYNEERKEMFDKYEELQETFEQLRDDAQDMALSAETREEKRDEAEEMLIDIRKLERDIRRFEESRRKQLDEQQQRMREGIVAEIREIVETYARDHGYMAVVDSSGQSLNGVEVILYVDAKVDITTDILELLNKGHEVIEE
jgi:Skp family chaperone for outer membrane proteins